MIIITEHAYNRGKERLGLANSAFEKLAIKAFDLGITHSDTKGKINRYITSLWYDYKKCNNIRIYGENIFFFAGNTLVTVYQIPVLLRKHLKYQK